MSVRSLVATLAAAALLLSGCGSPTDRWADEQVERLRDAGVTFPEEQARNTVIALVTTCTSKDVGMDLYDYTEITPMTSDWLSEADAMRMWSLADEGFCSSVPDGPLGEG